MEMEMRLISLQPLFKTSTELQPGLPPIRTISFPSFLPSPPFPVGKGSDPPSGPSFRTIIGT